MMSANWIALALMPLALLLVIVLECSRFHCARVAQRRLGASVQTASTVADSATRSS